MEWTNFNLVTLGPVRTLGPFPHNENKKIKTARKWITNGVNALNEDTLKVCEWVLLMLRYNIS